MTALGAGKGTPRSRKPVALTQCEWDVLAGIAAGQSNEAIAIDLCTSLDSVGNFCAGIYTKLGVRREGGKIVPRVLAALAFERGQVVMVMRSVADVAASLNPSQVRKRDVQTRTQHSASNPSRAVVVPGSPEPRTASPLPAVIPRAASTNATVDIPEGAL